MYYIDLRNDTVTKPTDEMREAMARAEVGDDVYLEDPTANRLRERGVLANGINPREMRMVTHKDVSRKECETSVKTIAEVFVRCQLKTAGQVEGD